MQITGNQAVIPKVFAAMDLRAGFSFDIPENIMKKK